MGKVPDSPQYADRCICGGCPSYPGDGGFYCARGKSANPVTKRGCICADCENFQEFDLKDGYYCVAGAAGEGAE